MSTPPCDEAQIEKEVRTAFASLVAASKTLHIDQYMALFDAQRFIGLNTDGSTWQSLEDLRALVQPGFEAIEKIDHLVFHKVKVSVINPITAILANEYEQVATLKDGSPYSSAGGGVQVWSKTNDTWKLVSVSSSMRPAA